MTVEGFGRFGGHRKQARRTGMSGPLGELFDHGARWLSCVLAR